MRDYQRVYRRTRAVIDRAGPSLLPAGEARAHLAVLTGAGTLADIAVAAGLSQHTLWNVANVSQWVRSTTAAKILAVSPGDVAAARRSNPDAYTPAGPTAARLWWLLDQGATWAWLADQLGTSNSSIRRWVHRSRPTVRVATATRVEALVRDVAAGRVRPPGESERLEERARRAESRIRKARSQQRAKEGARSEVA